MTIPKGVAIAADIWTIHNDPEIWGSDVDKFNPERFETDQIEAIRYPISLYLLSGSYRKYMTVATHFVGCRSVPGREIA